MWIFACPLPDRACLHAREGGNGWRNRIGEEGVEWLLTQTIEAGRKFGAIDDASLKRVAVDATVMEKAIAHPGDARLAPRLALQGWPPCPRQAGPPHA